MMVRTLHLVELNESNNDQRDNSAASTVADDILRKKLRGSRDLGDIEDTRPKSYGQSFPSGPGGVPLPPQTPKEKLKAHYREARVLRRKNMEGAITQGKWAISDKFKKGWKGSKLEPEKAALERAKWPNPGGSTHIISRGQKKVKGAKPLPGAVHGEEKDMARPVGEGGEVTRNLVARNLNKKREGGTQVVPKKPPFEDHSTNIDNMVKLGNEYGGTPSRKDRAREKRKEPQRPSVKIER